MVNPFFLIPLVGLVLTVLIVCGQFLWYGRLWRREYMSGAQISSWELIGMTFRKVDATLVVNCLVRLAQGRVAVSVAELESAYLQGVDIEKITTAALVAKNRTLEFSFKELVAADLEGQLATALGISADETDLGDART